MCPHIVLWLDALGFKIYYKNIFEAGHLFRLSRIYFLDYIKGIDKNNQKIDKVESRLTFQGKRQENKLNVLLI